MPVHLTLLPRMVASLLGSPHRRHLTLTVLVGVGLAVYLTGAVTTIYGFDLALILALVGGFPTFSEAARNLMRRQISADLAVSLAALAAIYIGQYVVAAEVMFIMLIGESLENFAIGRTRAGIAALLALRPHEARVRRDGSEQAIHADEVRPDDIVLLRPGDRIPVDGRVLSGHSSVDQSSMTGESLPADKGPGDPLFAGTINLYGAMEVAVERLGEDTALEHIIHLVEEAEAAKAPTQRLADRYATWFVPIVLVAALVVYLITRDVTRSVAVLVVACPCALVLATPTAIAAGIGGLVRRGVLVKGGNVFEQLGKTKCFVFDKTGTLTLAKLRIAAIVPASGVDEKEVLHLGAAVERQSEHPLGRLLVERAQADGIASAEVSGFLAEPGLGAQAKVEGSTIRVGSLRYLQQAGVEVPADLAQQVEQLSRSGCTVILIAKDQRAIGAAGVEDTIRGEAREAIARLRQLGVRRIVMLTGDHAAAAKTVADRLGVDEYRSDLLPADKVEAVRQLARESAPVVMVGDGVNDAPSLVAADVGVAMADVGSDVAVASADVVLVGGDLRKLADAVNIGRLALKIIWQNIIAFALVFNVAAVIVASLGWMSPVAAAVVHQISSLTVVLNSLRLLIDPPRWRRRFENLRLGLVGRWKPLAAGAVLIAAAIYVASGLHMVNVGQIGVVQRFGQIVDDREQPGLHYRWPYPFGQHWIVNPDETRRVEIGFRTTPGVFAEPPAYDWNVQHRGGRYDRQQEEGTVWTGDESLAEVNLVVQYRIRDPLAALFHVGRDAPDRTSKWDALVRAVAEQSLRAEMSHRPADDILGESREVIEAAVQGQLVRRLKEYGTGFDVQSVCLGDVHPPLEVVPAFREVASALEERESRINDAEAYQFETEAMARGMATQRVVGAEGARTDRTRRAAGAAARFLAIAAAFAEAPQVTQLRLYLSTVEELLAGRRKVILDHVPAGARRLLYLGPKGLFSLPSGPAATVPATAAPPEEAVAP